MNHEELKPCPFCGANPETRVELRSMGSGSDSADFGVICPDCGITKMIRLSIGKRCSFEDVEMAMDTAKELWNRRANDV